MAFSKKSKIFSVKKLRDQVATLDATSAILCDLDRFWRLCKEGDLISADSSSFYESYPSSAIAAFCGLPVFWSDLVDGFQICNTESVIEYFSIVNQIEIMEKSLNTLKGKGREILDQLGVSGTSTCFELKEGVKVRFVDKTSTDRG